VTPEEVATALQNELFFDPRTARAYARARGRCEYCGRDVVIDRWGYACGNIDHLLPVSGYADEVTAHPDNFVLSCSLCNGIKGKASILKSPENALEMLQKGGAELIARANVLIRERLAEPNRNWERAKVLFQGLSNVAQPSLPAGVPASAAVPPQPGRD